jgi:hypothetical protein
MLKEILRQIDRLARIAWANFLSVRSCWHFFSIDANQIVCFGKRCIEATSSCDSSTTVPEAYWVYVWKCSAGTQVSLHLIWLILSVLTYVVYATIQHVCVSLIVKEDQDFRLRIFACESLYPIPFAKREVWHIVHIVCYSNFIVGEVP